MSGVEGAQDERRIRRRRCEMLYEASPDRGAPSSRRFLLRQAVHRAQTEDEVDGVNAHDLAVRK